MKDDQFKKTKYMAVKLDKNGCLGSSMSANDTIWNYYTIDKDGDFYKNHDDGFGWFVEKIERLQLYQRKCFIFSDGLPDLYAASARVDFASKHGDRNKVAADFHCPDCDYDFMSSRYLSDNYDSDETQYETITCSCGTKFQAATTFVVTHKCETRKL